MPPSFDVRDSTPDTVDMRDVLWPVENVGQVAAAAASAAVTALEYHCNRIGEPPTRLSTLFVHYNARQSMGQDGVDTGTTLETALKAITTHGACREESWPFDSTRVTAKPSAQAYEEARKFSAAEYSNPADMLEALALRYPVPFVARIPERCLREAGRTGILPPPTTDELQRADGQLNHAMVLVGYDRAAKTVTARNCWGKEWGREGHCTIAFDTMKVIAPQGTKRLWMVTKAAAAASPQPVAPAYAPGAVSPAAAPAVAAAPPPAEKLSDLAARLRAEIRGDVERDITDATRRIRDRMGNAPGAAPPQRVDTRDACPTCWGKGVCPTCGGRGCTNCGGGNCPRCGGRGTA